MAWGLTNRVRSNFLPYEVDNKPVGYNPDGDTIWHAIRRANEAYNEGKKTTDFIREEVARQTQGFLFRKSREEMNKMELLKKTESTPTTTGIEGNKKYLLIGGAVLLAFFLMR